MSSILNSSTAILGAGGKFSGTFEKLGVNIESVSVVIKSNVSGSVKIIFADNPSLPSIFTHSYEYDHTQEFHRVVSKKGQYLKVQYTNGEEAQLAFQLKTYLKTDFEVEQTTEGGNDVNVTNEYLVTEVMNDITVTGLTFTEEGALIVSGGGSGGGDATAANQTTQIEKAQATNDKLDTLNTNVTKCDTDNIIIDSSTPINTLLLAKVETTDNNAYLTVNGSQHLNVNITNDKLQVYEEPLITTEPIYLDFNNNSAQVIGDSPAGCWYNPLDDVEGWGYANEIAGGAQVYYYTNTGIVPNAAEGNITLGSVTTGWCVASLNIITTTDNTWIMGVYTKPTGSGDAQPWYKSRKSYQVSSSFPLSKGVDYLFYWGANPTTVHPELQHVEMALASTQGSADPSEIVQFMSLNIPSVVPQYQFVGRVKRAGYVHSGVSREVHFLNSNKVKSELKLGQLKFNTLVPDDGEGALFVNVENDIGVTGSISLVEGSVVGLTGPIGLTGPVESRCYGSSDGTTWHHLKTNSTGVLSTNTTLETANGTLTSTLNDEINALDVQVQNVITSNLRTSVNGLLSSTLVAGPTGYNALDVSVKQIGDVSSVLKTATNGTLTSTLSGTGNSINSLDVNVRNTSITAIQKSQPASIQTVLTNEICNCTGPADSRALTTSYDTTGFLYVSVILNITNFSMSGNGNPTIYLQSSPDGVLWFNESSNSIYQNGAIKIQVYSVLTVPYVRLYLDCNSITPPNVIQFTISTALLCQK